MEDVINTIESNGQHWGIVTNKPGFLTNPLLECLNLHKRTGSVISGDTLEEKKPHPAPLLQACMEMKSNPERAMYIGDDARDIEAGKRANMFTLAAAYGFIVEEDDPVSWNADAIIYSPTEIHDWLN